MLRMLLDWSARKKRKIYVATVNHNLRKEAAKEAEFVSDLCARFGVPHEILDWSGWKQRGNLQDAARNARKTLLSEWAQRNTLSVVLIGHTQDDQAETVLMRMLRGSGVDGLAGIYPLEAGDGFDWLRPLLGYHRQELREYLRVLGQTWMDDPSNTQTRFDRVKLRQVLSQLNDAGFSTRGLITTGENMKRARHFLEGALVDHANDMCQVTKAGSIIIDRTKFARLSAELRYRLLAHCLKHISGNAYPPRLAALSHLETLVSKQEPSALHGCFLRPVRPDLIEVSREVSAMPLCVGDDGMFDGTWKISQNGEKSGIMIKALGETGLSQIKDWRDIGLSRYALMATPAVWRKQQLIAAPIAGMCNGYTCRLTRGYHEFLTSIQTH
ncbi:UNVERIFIED_CONTAM: hypothetical protein GTU68_050526 [Idotea baltica]|nr:hypothetical protein [Idotea baltica]